MSRYTWIVVLVLLGIGILPAPTHAGKRTPHFQPERGIFGSYGFNLHYQTTVRKVLFPNGLPATEFGAVILPSFTSEWTLFLHPPVNNHATVEVRIVDGQVWNATQMGDPVPGFTAHTQELDANVELLSMAASFATSEPCRTMPMRTSGSDSLSGTSTSRSIARLARHCSRHQTAEPNRSMV